jgi:hypothetical protein
MASILRVGASLAVGLALVPLAAAGSRGSGLYGVVRRGPIAPVCRAGVPCDAPAPVKLVLSRARADGGSVYWLRSDEKGRYRIALPPGIYRVGTGKKPTIGSGIKPHAVHVRAGRWDRIDFFVDTGIR